MSIKMGETTRDASKLGRRDAFHVAAVLVKSNNRLLPGMSVKFSGGTKLVVGCDRSEEVGIVDPFIRNPTAVGELFWVMLNPDRVDNLTHHFELVGVEEDRDDREDRVMAEEIDDDWCQRDCYEG